MAIGMAACLAMMGGMVIGGIRKLRSRRER